MRRSTSTAIAGLATLALCAVPATASAAPPADVPVKKGHANKPTKTTETPSTPRPSASLPTKAKAYGKRCQGQSKKHVKGQKGTPFSQCVRALAKAAHDEKSKSDRKAAKRACKALSKRRVKGQKGTPYSQCVRAAAKLRKDQAKRSD